MTIRTIDSKPSIEIYNSSERLYIMETGKTHSDIYAIPIIEEQRNVFGYSGSIYNYHEVVAPDERSHLLTLNLNPIRSKVSNGVNPFDFRYLYTGREYNIETGDYYYRARVMDSSVGRFSSKDPIVYLNLYRYVRNNPMSFSDPSGKSLFSTIGKLISTPLGAAASLWALEIGIGVKVAKHINNIFKNLKPGEIHYDILGKPRIGDNFAVKYWYNDKGNRCMDLVILTISLPYH